ncbi:MAG: HAMP domain-containing histidine kinase [Chroococcidiopsidaceae cyanobacterium CP_BM_ER_R8_30]|nr:HAMP domain-containing histidine kinase [Chroococcidiopsidaceae cyanobacterium CP_BM_ER_R8_30]
MVWSDWIYLGVGIGLGLWCSWLWAQRGRLANSASINSQQEVAAPNRQNLLEQLEAYQLAYQLAEDMCQFKAGFLTRVSHELRSPLNSLIGLHQLILSDLCENPDEEREFIAKANESALKLLKLLDEILSVARVEHGTNQLEIQPLQLAAVLQEIYQLTHLLALDRNFQLRISSPDPDVYILADPRWLRQVLVSLVSTSLVQMEEGSIYISAKTSSALDVPLEAAPTARSYQVKVPPEVAHKLTLSELDYIHIWLDIQMSPEFWRQEAVDLMHGTSVNQTVISSSGLSLMMNQTLLELMKGRLEAFPISVDANEFPWTRIQLTVPIVSPEIVTLEAEED